MTATIRRIAFAFVVCALLGTSALADVKKNSVTINSDVTVGDTVVKKGSYKVTFDEQTQELKILKGDKVVAQTQARLEEVKSAGKYKSDYTTVKDAAGVKLLSSVSIGGKYAVVSSEKVAAAMAEAARDTQ
ncbi:MAG TPA: hypothetical protein VK421_01290 [Pyrinomonadaceae bacterium]|nr:hypothetical protein [Pyrinomonadaceae bacterium]